MLYTDARNLGFPTASFEIALCGFMGWDDCFDFKRNEFIKPDSKAPEIRRVLKDGSVFACYSWEKQEDLTWMEDAVLRHYPAILEDREYLDHRPIGMSYEKADGYEIIFRTAGFRDIQVIKQAQSFVSTDEEEWWRMMSHIGWASLMEKLEQRDADQYHRLKEAIFTDLQVFKHSDGFHFEKVVFYISGVK